MINFALKECIERQMSLVGFCQHLTQGGVASIDMKRDMNAPSHKASSCLYYTVLTCLPTMGSVILKAF